MTRRAIASSSSGRIRASCRPLPSRACSRPTSRSARVRVIHMGLLGTLLLGNGTLRETLRKELEAEGLVRIEEQLRGSVRYEHFKAPGKRFHGKITPQRIGLGISETRVVAYCRSGRAKLMDS